MYESSNIFDEIWNGVQHQQFRIAVIKIKVRIELSVLLNVIKVSKNKFGMTIISTRTGYKLVIGTYLVCDESNICTLILHVGNKLLLCAGEYWEKSYIELSFMES